MKLKKSIVIIVTMLISILLLQLLQPNTAYAQYDVVITYNGQEVDSFCGVPAKYECDLNFQGSYPCNEYVARFYSTIYGVTISNMFLNATPVVNGKDDAIQVWNPQPGDIGYQTYNGGPHWFIVKSVSGNVVTVIEQNWKWAQNGGIMTTVDRQMSTSGLKFFRASSSQSPAVGNKANLVDLGTGFTAAITYYKKSTDVKTAVTAKDATKGSNVQISKQNGAWKKNQMWNFERLSDGSYYIKNVQSGYYLDVDNEKTTNGTNIKTWENSNSTAQKWCIVAIDNGGYRLIPKHCYDAGVKACLDIDTGSMNEGTNVHLWDYLGKPNDYGATQRVYIEKTLNLTPEDLGTGFTAAITYYKNATDVKTAVTAKNATKGSNVQISKKNGEWKENQLWVFERQSDETYYIKNVQSGYYLDVDNEKTTNGTNIKTWENSNSTAQKWYIVKNSKGYRLIPKHCYDAGVKACLDIDTGSMAEGTNVHLWEFLNNPDSYGATQIVNIEKYEANKYELGDINGDGKVNARDAKLALQYFNGNATLTKEQQARADINGDGKINARDAKVILQKFNGK